MKKHSLIRNAVHFALTTGVAASLTGMSATAFAQEEEADKELDKVRVTGSRISRVDLEGPEPVTVISREDIDASGDISVAEVLRGSTFNSFGSFKESSGSSAQSQATVSLRGVGSQRTLVLLDGRRISYAPTLSGAANLNTLPLASVERIEILRDSASAVYGSDAIGGVINVILRKDFEGVQLSAGMGRPTQDGGDEASGSIVGGISSARGNLLFSLEHSERDRIFNGDRLFSRTGLSSFGFPGSFGATDPVSGAFAGTFPDARCPAGGPRFDGSQFQDSNSTGTGPGNLCQFNYARTSANEASIRRDNLFVNGTFEISDDTQFFGRATITKAFSFGRYAPTPQVGGSPFLPTMGFDNPNNPTIGGVDTNGDGVGDIVSGATNGAFDLSIFYRNVPGGFRDGLVDDILFDSIAGFNGTLDFMGGSEWEVAVQHSRQTSQSSDFGFASRSLTQQVIDDGTFDIFGVNDPNGPDPAIARSFAVDGFTNNESRIFGFDAQISFDLFQMNNGPVPLVVGIEYGDELFSQNFDEQQNQGNIDGSAGGADIQGDRSRYSVFAETNIPLASLFNVGIAARFDHYNDFGDTVNPKVSLEFRPLDTLLLRATYGTGFRAPTLANLFGTPAQSFNGAVDTLRCNASGGGVPNAPGLPQGNPCLTTQYQNFSGGNVNLDAEESDSYNVGVVWNPIDDFSVTVDYYNIEFDQQISTIPLQQILNNEAAGVGPGGTQNVFRGNNGKINFIQAGLTNLSGVKTSGVDLDVTYSFGFETFGDFTARGAVSHVLDFETETNPGSGFTDFIAGNFVPDYRANLSLQWTKGDVGVNLIGEFIEASDDGTTLAGGYANELGSWTTWNLQFNYATPWDGRLAIGARNLFDKDPPLNQSLSHPFYSNQLHDIYGRVPYVRYEQDL